MITNLKQQALADATGVETIDIFTAVLAQTEETVTVNQALDAIETALKLNNAQILSRLAVIFTDYKNAGFENSAQVTKFIMTEIEQIVKV